MPGRISEERVAKYLRNGLQDVFVCSSMCFPYRYGVNSLLLNSNGERFLDAQFTTGIEPRRPSDIIAPWFSLNFEGDDAESRLRQNRSGTYVVWSATGTRTSAVLDIDDDGDLDIVTNEFNTRPQVLRNNLSDTGRIHYVKIKLTGSESNRDALGAIVVVKTMYGAQRQLNNGASGYLSQSIMPLYFGLGTAEEIQEISVIWPSGKTQVLPGPLKANRVVEITEQ